MFRRALSLSDLTLPTRGRDCLIRGVAGGEAESADPFGSATGDTSVVSLVGNDCCFGDRVGETKLRARGVARQASISSWVTAFQRLVAAFQSLSW